MIVHRGIQQNSEQWHNLRRFIVTASEAHRIAYRGKCYACLSCGATYTRKRKTCDACKAKDPGFKERQTVERSDSADRYMYDLIAQSMGSRLGGTVYNSHFERGHEKEPKGAELYAALRGVDLEVVGFVTTDDGLLGCSPDRLVGDDGIYEGKAPLPGIHIGYMLEPGTLTAEYFVQCQMQLTVCAPERRWVDLVSYAELADGMPMPLVIERIERDEEFIEGMNPLLVEFVAKLHRTRAELIEMYGDFSRLPAAPAEPEEGLNISRSDVAAIYRASQDQPEANW